jgi:hypothetical protein
MSYEDSKHLLVAKFFVTQINESAPDGEKEETLIEEYLDRHIK